MKLKLKTWSQLESEGFKSDYPYCYRGDRKNPVARFRHHYCESLLGKTVEAIYLENFEDGIITAIHKGKIEIALPIWLFEDGIDLLQLKTPLRKKFRFTSKAAMYRAGLGFEFPCDFQSLSDKEAREVAEWILKVGAKV